MAAPEYISAQDRLESAYEAMQADNGRLNAVLDVFNSAAIEAMLDADQRLEAGAPLSPIDGMPIGVKANVAVAGQFHHAGIKAYASRRAEEDATVITRLRDAGAIITGTLNMDEGAAGLSTDNPWFGPTLHPRSTEERALSPGGSSGGSGAAVAAGFCETALGTDTLGSVRMPAALCGVFGFKASRDTALLDGLTDLAPSLDTVGVLARELDAAAAVMAVMLDRDMDGEAGEVVALDWDDRVTCEPAAAQAFAAFCQARDLGSTTLEPYDFERGFEAGVTIIRDEARSVHARRVEASPSGFSDGFRAAMQPVQPDELAQARDYLQRMRAAEFPDFILMPTVPVTAFAHADGAPGHIAHFTSFANLADRPAISFPIGKDADGLSIGAQLIGPRGAEAALVATLRRLLG